MFFTHLLLGVLLREDEPFDPLKVGLVGATAVVLGTNTFATWSGSFGTISLQQMVQVR